MHLLGVGLGVEEVERVGSRCGQALRLQAQIEHESYRKSYRKT